MGYTQSHSKPSEDASECVAACRPLRLQYVPPDMAVSRPTAWLGLPLLQRIPLLPPPQSPLRGCREYHPPVAMEWEVGVWIVSGFLGLWLTTTLLVGASPDLGRWVRCWDAPQTRIPLYQDY